MPRIGPRSSSGPAVSLSSRWCSASLSAMISGSSMARVDARASFPASAVTPGSVGLAQRGRQPRPGIGRFSRHGTVDRRAAFARGAHGKRYERLGHTADEMAEPVGRVPGGPRRSAERRHIGCPVPLEGHRQVGDARVPRRRMHPGIEHDGRGAQPGHGPHQPSAGGQFGRVRGHPVQEAAVGPVPLPVPYDVLRDLGRGTRTVVGVHVAEQAGAGGRPGPCPWSGHRHLGVPRGGLRGAAGAWG